MEKANNNLRMEIVTREVINLENQMVKENIFGMTVAFMRDHSKPEWGVDTENGFNLMVQFIKVINF